MQPEQWVRLYWEDQGFIACDGAGAEQRVDVKALLLSPVVIVLAVRVRHKVVATPVIFRATIDATAFRRGFVFFCIKACSWKASEWWFRPFPWLRDNPH